MEINILSSPLVLPILLWGVALMFLKLTTGDDRPGWLVGEAGVILIYLILMMLMIRLVFYMTEEGMESVLANTARQHLIASFGFFLLTSIAWKIWRRRQPENRLHKVINSILGVSFGAFIVVLLGGMAYSLYEKGELGSFIALLIVCMVGLGLLVGLFQLLQKVSKRFNL